MNRRHRHEHAACFSGRKISLRQSTGFYFLPLDLFSFSKKKTQGNPVNNGNSNGNGDPQQQTVDRIHLLDYYLRWKHLDRS